MGSCVVACDAVGPTRPQSAMHAVAAARNGAVCAFVAKLTGHGAVVDVHHSGADDRAHVEGNGGVGGVVDGDDGSASGNSGVVDAHVARGRDQVGLVIDWPLRSSAQRQQGSGKEEAEGGLHAARWRRSDCCWRATGTRACAQHPDVWTGLI